MKILVGYTGFVGSNIAVQAIFDSLFNSKNIQDAFGLNPDVLVYSGIPAEKFLANSQPEKDFEIIEQAIEAIKKINPKQVILISTVDVYPEPLNVVEDSIIDESNLQAYGKNRLHLEKWIAANYDNHLIVRLPALFGKGIKKNFIYDLINIAPSMLNQQIYDDLSSKSESVKQSYILQPNGFYKLVELTVNDKQVLKQELKTLGFTALNFTDSRAVFQFYNLDNLWRDINTALTNKLNKINLVTEPVSAEEIYQKLYNEGFANESMPVPPYYNINTRFDSIYGNNNGYIAQKQYVLDSVVNFVKEQTA